MDVWVLSSIKGLSNMSSRQSYQGWSCQVGTWTPTLNSGIPREVSMAKNVYIGSQSPQAVCQRLWASGLGQVWIEQITFLWQQCLRWQYILNEIFITLNFCHDISTSLHMLSHWLNCREVTIDFFLHQAAVRAFWGCICLIACFTSNDKLFSIHKQ